jgi:gamma-glutamyl hercynylcysteine S-oxide synthase
MVLKVHCNEDFELPSAVLNGLIESSKNRIFSHTEDLSPAEMRLDYGETINLVDWEVGHAGFFYDKFIRQLQLGMKPIWNGSDELFNSHDVPHKERWNLKLPEFSEIKKYFETVIGDLQNHLETSPSDPTLTYLYQLATFHGDMHAEAFLMMRQLLGYAPPKHFDRCERESSDVVPEMIDFKGGSFVQGGAPSDPFLYDNEKWGHSVNVKPFSMGKYQVTNKEYLEFVNAGGYEDELHWDYGGRLWLRDSGLKAPKYWVKNGSDWQRRYFDKQVNLVDSEPVMSISWFEASSYCKFKGLRLPSEVEWEFAASADDGKKNRFPWGNDPAENIRECAAFEVSDCQPVEIYSKGESSGGCSGMLGNVWEWTGDQFFPYPGYIVDVPYKEFSATSFGYHKVLKGGSWASTSRMLRNTWRNFYLPHRNDGFFGFRVCKSLED